LRSIGYIIALKETISSIRQLKILTLSATQVHSMGKGGDSPLKYMPAHRPLLKLGNVHFRHEGLPKNFSMLIPEKGFLPICCWKIAKWYKRGIQHSALSSKKFNELFLCCRPLQSFILYSKDVIFPEI
jgi:hypothetical protein